MKRILGGLFTVAFVTSVMFLSFLFGALTIEYRTGPNMFMRQLFSGVEVLAYYIGNVPNYLWMEARSPDSGVTRYDPQKAYNGLTLFTSAHAHKALLMTMDGRIVHEWGIPFSALRGDTATERDPAGDSRIHIRQMYLYPNGDILVIYIRPGDTPWGRELVKFDKDSKVLWTYMDNVHHDVTVDAEGRIFALTHSIRSTAIPGLTKFRPPILEDFFVILSADGKLLQKTSLVEALRDSKYIAMLEGVEPPKDGDVLHANAIDVVDARYAAKVPIAEEGQVLVSFRTLDTIALVDVEEEIVTWAYRGPWYMQHDPDMLENGNMLIFDNFGNFDAGGRSRIVEFDPATGEVVWLYSGDDDDILESTRISEQQRLPNGNTLIVESYNGRMIEVTPEKEVVWEYLSPYRSGENDELVAIISAAQRIDPGSLNFPFSGGNVAASLSEVTSQ